MMKKFLLLFFTVTMALTPAYAIEDSGVGIDDQNCLESIQDGTGFRTCKPGCYLDEDMDACKICSARYYCPGGQMAKRQGCPASYPYTVQGAIVQEDCYKICTPSDDRLGLIPSAHYPDGECDTTQMQCVANAHKEDDKCVCNPGFTTTDNTLCEPAYTVKYCYPDGTCDETLQECAQTDTTSCKARAANSSKSNGLAFLNWQCTTGCTGSINEGQYITYNNANIVLTATYCPQGNMVDTINGERRCYIGDGKTVFYNGDGTHFYLYDKYYLVTQ